MSLSTDTLFHFSNLDAITGILKGKLFWPVYNLETFTSEYYKDHKYAIPMVCFCDLDFHLTEFHKKEYGAFAIGVKKSWAIENKLNPVSYQLEQSAFTSANESLYQLLSALIDDSARDELPKEIMDSQIRNLKIKHLIHKFLLTINVFKKQYMSNGINYYDEREWRYVPEMVPDDFLEYEISRNNVFHRLAIDEKTFENEVEKKQYQDYINVNYPLKFNENDVDIIIVETKNEKTKIQETLELYCSNSFLTNKIKTYQEL